MNMIYDKKAGFEIVPMYSGQSPTGFQVIEVSTKEVIEEFGTFCAAEGFLDSKTERPKAKLSDSFAEVKAY